MLTQLAFTCSKLTIEILEQGVKYIQKYTIKTLASFTANGIVLVFLLLTLNIFHILFQCFYRQLQSSKHFEPNILKVLINCSHKTTSLYDIFIGRIISLYGTPENVLNHVISLLLLSFFTQSAHVTIHIGLVYRIFSLFCFKIMKI